jgi:acyl carrier protein
MNAGMLLRDRFVLQMVQWLNRRFARPGVVITEATPLFAGGLIDSIRILELIAWTERAIGHSIPDASIRMDNFATPARIAEVFVHEASYVGA